jgi:hypothetical protein
MVFVVFSIYSTCAFFCGGLAGKADYRHLCLVLVPPVHLERTIGSPVSPAERTIGPIFMVFVVFIVFVLLFFGVGQQSGL